MKNAIRAITIEAGPQQQRDAKPTRFPVSVSSDNPIARRDPFGGDYEEILSHEPSAVDLSRSPLPVIEGHDRTAVNVGIVTGLRVAGGRLRGELVMGTSQRAQELAADIAAGIVSGLSVGYQITEVREERGEDWRRVTATRWMPYEVSIVSVPADISVGINRSAHMEGENTQQPQQRNPNQQRAAPLAPVPPPAPLAPAQAPEILAERERVVYIDDQAQRYAGRGLDRAFADHLIQSGASLDLVREAVLERLAQWSDAAPPSPNAQRGAFDGLGTRSPIVPGQSFEEDFRSAAVDALLLRSGIPVAKPHAAARDVSPSVHDLARLCLSRAGRSESGRFGSEARGPELIKRAMTTSDFPLLLAGALHASVRSGYEQEPSSHRAWVRAVPVPDFRLQERPILGSAPDLEIVHEHGEYREGSLTEDSTRYKVDKYGKIVALSWEVLVNDNLSAFLRVQPALGQAARRKEADLVYGMFGENAGAGPVMQDGTNLFHADHGNLVQAGAFSADLLGAGRTLLRKQRAGGGGWLSLAPKYWIVPVERETAAEQILANASRRTTTEKSTPEWISQLELVVEPRLANTSAYLAAASGQIDTVELGLLEENVGGPVLEEEQEFSRDVKRWKVRHTFRAKPLDWRGLVRMPLNP